MTGFDPLHPNSPMVPVADETDKNAPIAPSVPTPNGFDTDDIPYTGIVKPPPPPPPAPTESEEYVPPQYKATWLSSFITWGLLFILALLLFGLGTQVLHYYSIVATLPLLPRWIFLTGGTVCLTVIIVVIIKIAILWFRIKNNNIAVLLEERNTWQFNAAASDTRKTQKARELLEEYLGEFDFEQEYTRKNTSDKAFFLGLGMPESDFNALKNAKKELLEPTKPTGSQDWIRMFQTDFQAKLDDIAKQRVTAYYYKVLWGTAISPRAMVDQIIVLLATTSLIRELLQIYRLKPAPGQTLFLLVHAFFNVYASGNVQDTTENVMDNLGKAVENGYAIIKEDLMAATSPTFLAAVPVVGKAFQFIGSKFAEGAINALLLRNISRNVIQAIQPTRVK